MVNYNSNLTIFLLICIWLREYILTFSLFVWICCQETAECTRVKQEPQSEGTDLYLEIKQEPVAETDIVGRVKVENPCHQVSFFLWTFTYKVC